MSNSLILSLPASTSTSASESAFVSGFLLRGIIKNTAIEESKVININITDVILKYY